MSVYENVPLNELESELKSFSPCWLTLVIAGVALRSNGKWLLSAIQIWASDSDLSESEIVTGPPSLSDDTAMFTLSLRADPGIAMIMSLLHGGTIDVQGFNISAEYFHFTRAAFLGADDYNYLYPEELHRHVNTRPKLFFEGRFDNRNFVENAYKTLSQELEKSLYTYHSIWDAASHIVGFRTGGGYFHSGFAGALGLSVEIDASIAERRLTCKIDLPQGLGGLSRRAWYVARSIKGERDETLTLSKEHEANTRLIISAGVEIPADEEVVEVVLALAGRRISASKIWALSESDTGPHREVQTIDSTSRSGEVFIVHGRNHFIRDSIRAYLIDSWNLRTEVMELEASTGRTLTEKFEDIAGRCSYAIIILTGDDRLLHLPFARKKRARQNVVLELGFFWGRLGRKNLCILSESAIEQISDISGMGYVPITDDLAVTKLGLVEELRAAGIIRTTN